MKRKIPHVEVEKRRRLTISIWFVPLIALLISLWLAYQYFSQLGPQITIEFKSSAGLKANQSQIKFRDVPIGVVKKISLTKAANKVLITARINKDAKMLINENAKFWIVKPKIDKSGITGLETLVSGSYIELYGKIGRKLKKHFIGLDEPYQAQNSLGGKYFRLYAPNSYDLSAGSLLFYKNIEVGEVKKVSLSDDGKNVIFNIFIKHPNDKYINKRTRFWHMSNFKIDISKARLDVSLASSSQILKGGIAFDTPMIKTKAKNIKSNQKFYLYANKADAYEKSIIADKNMKIFQFDFNQSIAKLPIDAPIKFQGYKVGNIINIDSKFNPNKRKIESIVLANIDLSSFGNINGLEEELKNGLVAKLKESNPILDSLYVDLQYDRKNSYKIVHVKPYDIFPTQKVKFDNLSSKFTQLINSVNNLLNNTQKPIQSVLKNLNKTIRNTNLLIVKSGVKKLPKQINNSLKELERTLQTTRELINSNSQMSDTVSESMKEVNRASKQLQRVLNKIDKKPNSLIFGE